MFRKFIIAAAAAATLGATALVPTTASAGWHGGHFHGGHWGGRGWGRGWGGPYVGVGYYGYGGCGLAKQRVWTRAGWCWRWVRVCYY